MKSPFYILTILLPLATELATASPAAEPDFDSLEGRTDGGGGGGGRYHDNQNNHHDNQNNRNPCHIDHKYWYWKYPCDQSDKTFQEFPGGQFTAFCKYHNWYKTQKGWVHDSDKPQQCHGNWDRPCSS